MYEALAILSALALVYGAIAKRVERTVISGPMIFVAFGFAIGPSGLSLVPLDPDAEEPGACAELTLALVLFTDAAGTDMRRLLKEGKLPVRLLGIGLPLTILLGVGAGAALFPALPLITVAILATMLAPTDAALGKAVVSNEAVPGRVREGLNVESRLNDGICVPILFLFLALATGESAGEGGVFSLGIGLFVRVVGIGIVTGAALAVAGILLLRAAVRRDWISPSWGQVLVIALAFACFGTAQVLGGSGFIACFLGGMLFGALLRPHHGPMLYSTEGAGDAFGLLTWTLFGAALVGPALSHFSWQVPVYALLSLTVVRMLPVFISTCGLGQSVESRLFMGWFGPRGLASIVFVVIVIGQRLPHAGVLTSVVCWTVLLSVLLHGVTAQPWARAFGARSGQPGDES